ncbi:RNA polymerase sigma factor [Polaribacter sp.]|uniref:RNA polymerase sigma factor n=1 Tax=Polaribacter sp. TaxID=1920175 RepID=UPI004048E53E
MDVDFLEGLKNGDEKTLKKIYLSYKNDFLFFAKKYQLTDDEIIDIYQDAILALRENAEQGKIKKTNSSLKTYFFSIGKYMIYEELRRKKKMIVTNDFEEELTENEYDFLFKKELTSTQKKLQIAFKNLGNRCKEILTLFYFYNYSLDDIKKDLNYDSKDVVKSQKHRCLKSLKDKMV